MLINPFYGFTKFTRTFTSAEILSLNWTNSITLLPAISWKTNFVNFVVLWNYIAWTWTYTLWWNLLLRCWTWQIFNFSTFFSWNTTNVRQVWSVMASWTSDQIPNQSINLFCINWITWTWTWTLEITLFYKII